MNNKLFLYKYTNYDGYDDLAIVYGESEEHVIEKLNNKFKELNIKNTLIDSLPWDIQELKFIDGICDVSADVFYGLLKEE